MIGVALGAHVVAVDVNDAALALARDLGAERLVNARETPDTVAAVKDAIGGGAHVSVDALGSPQTAVASVRSLRRRGRHVQVGLLLGEQSTPPIPMDLVLAKELDVLGSHGMAARDYPGMLDLVARGLLQPRRLVGRVISLDEAGAAIAEMSGPSPTAGMTVVAVADPAV
jgi:alcohol dehydrogenase